MWNGALGPCPRELSENAEKDYLSIFAALSKDPRASSRLHPLQPDDYRTAFERDYTRIIHNRAFRRLRRKTQVFLSPKNDHLCTRLEHSLHVASISRTISKALALNNDLVAAIAVGHDLGHAPFGHYGEGCLDKIAQRLGFRFHHELQSLRVVDCLDSRYEEYSGLNLTFAVRDGIACHYGEGFEKCLAPNRNKKPEDLPRMPRGERPATLEGCVVRFADNVAYLGRDMEDAVAQGIISPEDLPVEVTRELGRTNGQIIGALIGDIVECSKAKDYIAVSDRVHVALNKFNQFNIDALYRSPKITAGFEEIDAAVPKMFEHFYELIRKPHFVDGAETPDGETAKCVAVFREFLVDDVRDWVREKPEQLVIDFIAGMTDEYFMTCYEELFVPKGASWILRSRLGT